MHILHLLKVVQMSFNAILNIIKDEMGLSPESIGIDTIERIVERRIKTISEKSVSSYCKLVKASAAEKQALFNEVSVPETWFFRDHEPFKVLSNYINELDLAGRPLKILSIPCSSGEEPYSIAMVLNDLGLSKDQFRIDAVDISTEVIKKARKGVYGNHSFRGKEIVYRDKYFEHKDGMYVISDDIKASVSFYNKNVLDDDFMNGKGPYDVVFCRNLLIYFDYETKCKVLSSLHRLMTRKALLVLGHAETGRMPDGLFESLHLPGSFAYNKACASSAKAVKAASAFSPARPRQPVLPKPKYLKTVVADTSSAGGSDAVLKNLPLDEIDVALPVPGDINVWLDSIQSLADSGQLKEAITECDRLIKAVPDSAQGYYLRGVVLLAFDANEEATDSFKKAVYLDPKNYQSLINLAVLSEESGDFRGAENYRARAERLRKNAQAVVD